MLVAGHSNWLKYYSEHLMAGASSILGSLDPTCSPFATGSMRNLAVLRVGLDGKCGCLYDGNAIVDNPGAEQSRCLK